MFNNIAREVFKDFIEYQMQDISLIIAFACTAIVHRPATKYRTTQWNEPFSLINSYMELLRCHSEAVSFAIVDTVDNHSNSIDMRPSLMLATSLFIFSANSKCAIHNISVE